MTFLVTDLSDELVLEIMYQIDCTRTLNRAASCCKDWHGLVRRDGGSHTWARVSATTCQDVLNRAPAGARISVAAGVKLSGPLLLPPRAIHLRAEAGVVLMGLLILQDTSGEVCAFCMHACSHRA